MKTSAGLALALKNQMEVTFSAKSPHMIRIYVKCFNSTPIMTNSKVVTLSEIENAGLIISKMVQEIKEHRRSQ